MVKVMTKLPFKNHIAEKYSHIKTTTKKELLCYYHSSKLDRIHCVYICGTYLWKM